MAWDKKMQKKLNTPDKDLQGWTESMLRLARRTRLSVRDYLGVLVVSASST